MRDCHGWAGERRGGEGGAVVLDAGGFVPNVGVFFFKKKSFLHLLLFLFDILLLCLPFSFISFFYFSFILLSLLLSLVSSQIELILSG